MKGYNKLIEVHVYISLVQMKSDRIFFVCVWVRACVRVCARGKQQRQARRMEVSTINGEGGEGGRVRGGMTRHLKSKKHNDPCVACTSVLSTLSILPPPSILSRSEVAPTQRPACPRFTSCGLFAGCGSLVSLRLATTVGRWESDRPWLSGCPDLHKVTQEDNQHGGIARCCRSPRFVNASFPCPSHLSSSFTSLCRDSFSKIYFVPPKLYL